MWALVVIISNSVAVASLASWRNVMSTVVLGDKGQGEMEGSFTNRRKWPKIERVIVGGVLTGMPRPY